MTLTEFVTERLDEWEQAARDAQGPDGFGDARTFYTTHGPHRDDWGVWTFHVDPARVLAQVAAMRAIVAMYERAAEAEAAEHTRSAAWVAYREERTAFQRALEALAAIWSDHDQYDPACAPEGE